MAVFAGQFSSGSSGMFGWYRVVRGCPRHRHEIAIGTQHYPLALASTIPPAHLLPVPVWSIVTCKFWTGLSNFQLFGWQPAILIHRSTSFIRVICTLHFTAVIVRRLLLALTAAVTISPLAGQGLPWCRLSVLYTLPLLHILEAAKGWSWAFDPVTYHFHLGFTCLITDTVFAAIYIHANCIWDDSWWSLQHVDSKDPLMSVDWNAVLATAALVSKTASGTNARSRHQMY